MNENFGSSTKIPPDATGDEPTANTAQPEVTQPTPPEKALKPGTADLSIGLAKPADQGRTIFAGCLVWVIAILSAVAMFVNAARQFLYHWWWAIGAGVGLVALLVYLAPPARRWFAKKASEAARTGVVVFAVLPLLLVAIGTIVLLPRPNQITVVRSVFLTAVCLFPALMYYLFIAARKISLLNDYFVNLGRLGLLQTRQTDAHGGPDSEFKVRLLNYVQKFEALYGPLPPESRNAIVGAKDPLFVLVYPSGSRESGPSPIVSPSAVLPFFSPETAIPVVLATVLIAVGWLMALPPLGFETPAANGPGFWSTAFSVSADPIVYAFLGAYFFSLQMLFRRYVREDLRKSAYLAVSLRIILAVIGTWVAIKATTAITGKGKVHANDTSLLVIGFVIGVFPRIAWQFIQGAWKAIMKKLRLSKEVLPSMESGLPLSDLDGLTVWHEARLEEEDVENIPNMATTEIVDLMLRTRFSPDRIIDWVDQAILFMYLGPDQKEKKRGKGDKEDGSRKHMLRLHGIRTATSLIQAFEKAQVSSRNDAKEVEEILSKASHSHIRSLLDAIETEPNLALIMAWRTYRT